MQYHSPRGWENGQQEYVLVGNVIVDCVMLPFMYFLLALLGIRWILFIMTGCCVPPVAKVLFSSP